VVLAFVLEDGFDVIDYVNELRDKDPKGKDKEISALGAISRRKHVEFQKWLSNPITSPLQLSANSRALLLAALGAEGEVSHVISTLTRALTLEHARVGQAVHACEQAQTRLAHVLRENSLLVLHNTDLLRENAQMQRELLRLRGGGGGV
jgi:hypothetical protein